MSEYMPPDLEEAKLKMIQAFQAGADYLLLYSRRQRWAADAIHLCQEQGWLDEGEFIDMPEEQYAEYRYRLTRKGRALVFGLTEEEQFQEFFDGLPDLRKDE